MNSLIHVTASLAGWPPRRARPRPACPCGSPWFSSAPASPQPPHRVTRTRTRTMIPSVNSHWMAASLAATSRGSENGWTHPLP
eukprot:4705720-Prymnesium_polylepis.1